VTYDSALATDSVKYYFGNPDNKVALDLAYTYTPTPSTINASGALTIGNFGTVVLARTTIGSNSRMFRGLMDEIQVWNRALTLAELEALQVAPSLPPSLLIAPQGNNVELSWETTASLQLQSRTNLSGGDWGGVTNEPAVSGNVRTLTLPANQEAEFFRLSP